MCVHLVDLEGRVKLGKPLWSPEKKGWVGRHNSPEIRDEHDFLVVMNTISMTQSTIPAGVFLVDYKLLLRCIVKDVSDDQPAANLFSIVYMYGNGAS